mmetsp:Transcript_22781/g.36943  ORF Transcript_22781/g.36943 Transcript_22781/m.36943 type:complete len:250 (-) Transcript_22781:3625-4374(-)
MRDPSPGRCGGKLPGPAIPSTAFLAFLALGVFNFLTFSFLSGIVVPKLGCFISSISFFRSAIVNVFFTFCFSSSFAYTSAGSIPSPTSSPFLFFLAFFALRRFLTFLVEESPLCSRRLISEYWLSSSSLISLLCILAVISCRLLSDKTFLTSCCMERSLSRCMYPPSKSSLSSESIDPPSFILFSDPSLKTEGSLLFRRMAARPSWGSCSISSPSFSPKVLSYSSSESELKTSRIAFLNSLERVLSNFF